MKYNSSSVKNRILEMFNQKGTKAYKVLPEIGLSKNTLDSTNLSMPKADTLAIIADYLNCSVDYLLGRTDNPNIKAGINVTDNKHDIINSDNSININTAPNKKTSELVELIEGLPLVKRAEAVLYLNDLKNKK